MRGVGPALALNRLEPGEETGDFWEFRGHFGGNLGFWVELGGFGIILGHFCPIFFPFFVVASCLGHAPSALSQSLLSLLRQVGGADPQRFRVGVASLDPAHAAILARLLDDVTGSQ